MAKDPMVPINLRVPQSLLDQIDEKVARLGSDRSDFIRRAISCLLQNGADSFEQRLADLERRVSDLEILPPDARHI